MQNKVTGDPVGIVQTLRYTQIKPSEELIDLAIQSIEKGQLISLQLLTANKFQPGKMNALLTVALENDMPILVSNTGVADCMNVKYRELYPNATREKIFYAYNSTATRQLAPDDEHFERGFLSSHTLTVDQLYEFISLTSLIVSGGFVGLT